jgi:hypothetical protein
MKIIFLSLLLEASCLTPIHKPPARKRARARPRQYFPRRLVGVDTRRDPVVGIVDARGDAMSAVGFHRSAAAGESHEENETAEDGEENVSHVEVPF